MQWKSDNLTDRQTRISYIDFLKFLGLTAIILAHMGPPEWIMRLRNFDVPLMVILSSFLGEKTFRKYERTNPHPLRAYCISRIQRLVLPTWCFLMFYFLVVYLFCGDRYSARFYVDSFCLTRYGIGYVWIILIYLYSAFLIPVLCRITPSMKNTALICAVYFVYEIMWHFQVGTSNRLLETTFYYVIPYGVVTALGCSYGRMKEKTRRIVAVTAFGIFAAMGLLYWGISGTAQSVQIAKYPPRLYYLGYGIGCSFALMLLCGKRHLKIFECSAVKYVSAHSMWIYLWHILALRAYTAFALPEVWYLKLIVVYGVSVLLTAAMNSVWNIIDKRTRITVPHYMRG